MTSRCPRQRCMQRFVKYLYIFVVWPILCFFDSAQTEYLSFLSRSAKFHCVLILLWLFLLYCPPIFCSLDYCTLHRIRIYTEEKAKVVAAYWGKEVLHFLSALAILHRNDLKNRLICTRTSWRTGCLFFNSIFGMKQFVSPQKEAMTFVFSSV